MKAFLGVRTFPQPVKAPYREGHAWKASELDAWVAHDGWAASLVGGGLKHDADKSVQGAGLMAIEEKLREAVTETEAAYDKFAAARDKFRSEIKNEIASIEASAKKIAAEFARVSSALDKITLGFNSAEFVRAMENAERLASALRSMQELQSSRITFSILDKEQA